MSLCFSADVLADSKPKWGPRVTTMMLTYPRCIHSEFMTHRSHSRNAASSRAIPIKRMLQDVRVSPFIPLHWGANQKGMQAFGEVEDKLTCEQIWLEQRDFAIRSVEALDGLGLHKQIANRLLEPWMWITVITTANNRGWDNFFRLRCHRDAEPHIQKIAYLARKVRLSRAPAILSAGDWHLPLVGFDGDSALSISDKVKVSVGRCARVSYLTHEGVRDVAQDIGLHDRLSVSKHWSPFEHQAQVKVMSHRDEQGNLGPGWSQYRKRFKDEFGE